MFNNQQLPIDHNLLASLSSNVEKDPPLQYTFMGQPIFSITGILPACEKLRINPEKLKSFQDDLQAVVNQYLSDNGD